MSKLTMLSKFFCSIKTSRKIQMLVVAVLAMVGTALTFVAWAFLNTHGKTQLEFNIHLNKELILMSDYGEPPQFAIWLENPETGHIETVFVTYRSATGDWDGKSECPGSLPLWFEIFKQEMNTHRLPGAGGPVHAVTGATPQAERFRMRVEVEPNVEWVCWIEVNLAGNYNESYSRYNPIAMIDESGQPSIVYKAELVSAVNTSITPELAGKVDITRDFSEMIQPPEGITTAKDIFLDLNIRVIRPKPYLFSWSRKYKTPGLDFDQ